MSYLFAFLVVFVVGPILLLALVRGDRSIAFFGGLGGVAAVLTISALYANRTPASENEMILAILLALWLAWVLALAICVRAFRVQFPFPKARRWSAVIGVMATTVPWLGYSAAIYVGQ